MGGKLSRTKGHSFERLVANLLKPLWPNAKRKLEYQEDECTGVDIAGTNEFKFQCKRFKSSVPMSKLYEIKEDGIHCLVSKVDNEPILLTMKFEDFLEVLSWNNSEGK